MSFQVGPAVRAAAPRDRLIDSAETERISGIKKSYRSELIEQGKFPAPIKLARRCVRWSEAAVLAWVQARIAEGSNQ